MKKEMHVVHVISSLKIGGAEALLVDLVDELMRQGVRSSVVFYLYTRQES